MILDISYIGFKNIKTMGQMSRKIPSRRQDLVCASNRYRNSQSAHPRRAKSAQCLSLLRSVHAGARLCDFSNFPYTDLARIAELVEIENKI